MSTISSLSPKQLEQTFLSGNSQFESSSSFLAMQAVRVTAAASLSKDIAIETAEGDKVTLSYSTNTGFQAASYGALYQNYSLVNGVKDKLLHQQAAQLHTDDFAYSQETQLTLSVEGDLNEQERQDIREALERIDKLMLDSLQGGDLFRGVQEATEIIALESVSAVDADYRYQSLITIEEMTQIASAANYGDSGVPKDLLPGLKNLERSASAYDQLQKLIDRMAEVIEDWSAEKKLRPEKFLRPVEKLFADHLKFLEDKPESATGQELLKYLGPGLLQKIRDMSESQLV